MQGARMSRTKLERTEMASKPEHILDQKIEHLKIAIDNHKTAICKAETDISEYRRQIKEIEYNTSTRIACEFWKKIGEEFGMTDHPKFGILREKAYERGHSAGYNEVRLAFIDLLELVK
jgi:hypothetical protein